MQNKTIIILAGLLCFTPWMSSPIALALGFMLSTCNLVPKDFSAAKLTKKLLAYSIVGLGFGIHFKEALTVTSEGIGLILTTIVATLILGTILAHIMKMDTKLGYLISTGTSICGGSAIAAVSPAIRANDQQIGLALATIFILNSVALFIFPAIGHFLNLDQTTFGTWAAIAIHDTSSVVGAASAYGEQALTTATTLKLSRALWIIPLAFISAIIFRSDSKKITVPYFILFYCLAILISDALPQFGALYNVIFLIAKQMLVFCLFLIGCSISIKQFKNAGLKPMLLGMILWVTISVFSLLWLIKI